ncbi:Serine incorporator 3 [Bienertia sinuspersici]
MDMESGTSTTATAAATTTKKKYPGIQDGTWFAQFRYGSNPWMARYVYGLIFLITNFLAWAVRDYGKGAMKEIGRLKGCKVGVDCLGTEGVLRVSMGCFMFFFAMFLSTFGTSKVQDRRDTGIQDGGLQKLAWEIAHFGAGIFLLIQLVSVISFIFWINDWCQSENRVHVMLTATSAYIVSIVGIIMMYIWYAPETSCLLNIFYITWTLVLLQLMTSVSLQPRINAGFLTPG